MSYIGRGVDNISNVEKLDNITFDGGTTYALTKSSVAYTPSGANNILISIDGIVQQGNFSVSTTNIVFDWSPTSSNTCDWIMHIGVGVLNVPADGSVSAVKMAANSVDSDSYVDGSIDAVHLSANSVDSDAYVDGSIDTAHIDALQVTGAKLNTDVISAQTELAVAPADADEFMVSDAGVLKRIDYSLIKGGGITEFDYWRLTSTLTMDASINTWTDITANWGRVTSGDGQGVIGTGLTDTSGIFSFPSTGYWKINYNFLINTAVSAGFTFYISMLTTTDNSSYSDASQIESTTVDQYDTTTVSQTFHFDVTDTSNDKFKFAYYVSAQNNWITGGNACNATGFSAIRYGDT